jgi:hypothetical protein
MFEMEQVLPGCDPDDIDSDPILQANALRERGRHAQARRLLSDLIAKDERCLDAHAHLGSMLFDKPKAALPHYPRGVEIGGARGPLHRGARVPPVCGAQTRLGDNLTVAVR